MAVKVGQVLIDIAADTTKLVKGMTKAQKSVAGAVKGMKVAIVGLVTGVAFKQLADIGSNFVKTAAQFEQFETTLTAISGSSKQAEKDMAWIEGFAKTTPFELDKVTESFVKMKAYGLDPMDGTLTALGNAASAMGKDVVQAVEAIADAVTGENERLKEFGIKAKKSGDTVAYSWSDSLGKMKNIVIKNNKDVIQSTLNAIFNEKYAGAMALQAKTWNGMISNISDSWTIFKKDVLKGGLFEYLKGIVGVVGTNLNKAFSDGASAGKEWADNIISGIKTTIVGFGNLYDIINGIDLVWEIMKNGAIEAFLAINEAWTWWGNVFDKVTVDMQNLWGSYLKELEKAWVNTVNFIGKAWNSFYADWAIGFNKISKKFGSDFRVDVPTFTPETVTAYEKIGYAQQKISEGTKYWTQQLKESDAEIKKVYASVANEDGLKRARELIAEINAEIAKQGATNDDLENQKTAAQEALEKLLATQKALSEETDKSKEKTKDWGNAVKEVVTEYQQLALDGIDTLSNGMTNMFVDWQEGALNWKGTMKNVLNDILAQMFEILVVKRLISGVTANFDFNNFSDTLGLFSKGAAFNDGKVTAFARGGVVSSPTIFPMASGMGLMGEAGAEGVLPLTRINGDLGVRAEVTPVNVNVMNYGNDNVQVEQSDGNINVIISQIAQSISRGTGDIGNAIEGRYGIKKQ